jgi:hypothetical protein
MNKYTTLLEERKTLYYFMPMVSVDVDVITNNFVVGLEREVPRALMALQIRYGDGLTVEVLGKDVT